MADVYRRDQARNAQPLRPHIRDPNLQTLGKGVNDHVCLLLHYFPSSLYHQLPPCVPTMESSAMGLLQGPKSFGAGLKCNKRGA